jgi:mitochondrial chaperone BCS1
MDSRIDDHSLAKLISDTPSRSILLLEDIDCAFPSRDAENDDEEYDQEGNPMSRQNAPRSEVTLAGLLNVLDSVTSEEGRITFATVSLRPCLNQHSLVRSSHRRIT